MFIEVYVYNWWKTYFRTHPTGWTWQIVIEILHGNISYRQRFFMEIVHTDRVLYEPDVLSTMHRGIKCYLDDKKYGKNILQDPVFEKSRKVLAALRKKLKREGYGGRPNATRELTQDEIDRLWTEGYFGLNSGAQVQRALWWSYQFTVAGEVVTKRVSYSGVILFFRSILLKTYTIWSGTPKEDPKRELVGKVRKAGNTILQFILWVRTVVLFNCSKSFVFIVQKIH